MNDDMRFTQIFSLVKRMIELEEKRLNTAFAKMQHEQILELEKLPKWEPPVSK